MYSFQNLLTQDLIQSTSIIKNNTRFYKLSSRTKDQSERERSLDEWTAFGALPCTRPCRLGRVWHGHLRRHDEVQRCREFSRFSVTCSELKIHQKPFFLIQISKEVFFDHVLNGNKVGPECNRVTYHQIGRNPQFSSPRIIFYQVQWTNGTMVKTESPQS